VCTVADIFKIMNQKNSTNKQKLKVGRREMVKMVGAMSLGVVSTSSSLASPQRAKTNDILTFLTLREAKQSTALYEGIVVQTLGYYTLNDGGGSIYHIDESYKDFEANEGDVVLFQNGLVGVMVEENQINYKMFGAVGDGVNDDGVQIKNAHAYANKHKLSVLNYSGEYWIEETRNIPIQSAVSWGESIFHINEGLNTKNPVFRVSSRLDAVDIEVDAETKGKIVSAVKPGMQVLPELRDFKNSLISIVDENDRIGFRAGERYKGQSWAREEFFYLEEDGRVVGDIAWAFKDYTSLKAYPAENSYLVIDGGTFYLSGDNHPEPERKGYFQNGFSVTRSRTIIRNQWVGLEKGKADIAFNPRNGFYSFNSVYEVTLENVRLVPWEQDRPGTERDLYAGTYGIGARRVMNSTFRNVTAEGTMLHWGVFGTNLKKNFRIEKCQFIRIDVHFHCWNLTIQNSQIGNRGISVTGGGELIIENTSCSSQSFVNFRYDFGAKWEGPVYINNCKLIPNRQTQTGLLRFMAGNFDYRYPIGLAEQIHIRDFTFDFSTVPDNESECWLLQASAFSQTKQGERLFFPKNLICDGVMIKGRDKGARLMKITSPQTYGLADKGSYDGSFVKCNSTIHFNNIQLEDIDSADPAAFHFQITESADKDYDDHSLYPQIHFTKCENLFIDLGGAISNTLVENCTVSQFITRVDEKLVGEITFLNCRLLPKIFDKTSKPFYMATELATNFINCLLHLPRLDGELKPDLLHLLDFLEINKSVKYNHVNSRLGRDVVEHLNAKSITLDKKFISKLQSNYEV